MPTSPSSATPRPPSVGSLLRNWFVSPPRPHGEIEPHRTVSFVELFFDLVFVVLIAQIAHTLAKHITWSGVLDFSILFALVWIAWLNGSIYHDLHGRNDGRSRTYIFAQMPVLALMAVYAGHALDPKSNDGLWFSVLFAVELILVSRQWWLVRRYDDSAADRNAVARWVVGHTLIAAGVVAGGVLGGPARTWLWAGMIALWVVGMIVQGIIGGQRTADNVITESGAERFGLLTIIVLGEVVTGVVNGLLEADRTPLVILTAVLALQIGFGFWWNYFDSVGGRRVRRNAWAFGVWTLGHFPLTASIAAAGAGMVSLVAHANEHHTPAATAWLLAGASASMLVWVVVLVVNVEYEDGRGEVRSTILAALLIGAALSVLVGVWAPAPWLLALSLAIVHAAIWLAAFIAIAKSRADRGITEMPKFHP